MSEYVILVSNDPSHRKSIHRHIVEAKSVEQAAEVGTEMCSHGQHVDAVVEVFVHAGSFFSYALRPFTLLETEGPG